MQLSDRLKDWGELLLNNVSKLRAPLAPLFSFRNVGVGFAGAVATIGVAAAVITAGGVAARRAAPRGDNGNATASLPRFEAAGHGSDAFVRPGSQSFSAAAGGSAGSPGLGDTFGLDSAATNGSSSNALPLESFAYSTLPPEFVAPGASAAGGGTVLGSGSSSISNNSVCCSLPTIATSNDSGVGALSLSYNGPRLVFKNMPVVPEPSVAWLGSLGLVVVVARVRRMKKTGSRTDPDSAVNGDGSTG